MHLHKGTCDVITHDDGVPTAYQYFNDPDLGGPDVFMDYCPVIKQSYGGNCRGHDAIKTVLESTKYEEQAGELSRCVEGTFVKSGDPYEHAACLTIV